MIDWAHSGAVVAAAFLASLVEFVEALQLVGLVLLFLYPSIATWLPKAIGW